MSANKDREQQRQIENTVSAVSLRAQLIQANIWTCKNEMALWQLLGYKALIGDMCK